MRCLIFSNLTKGTESRRNDDMTFSHCLGEATTTSCSSGAPSLGMSTQQSSGRIAYLLVHHQLLANWLAGVILCFGTSYRGLFSTQNQLSSSVPGRGRSPPFNWINDHSVSHPIPSHTPGEQVNICPSHTPPPSAMRWAMDMDMARGGCRVM